MKRQLRLEEIDLMQYLILKVRALKIVGNVQLLHKKFKWGINKFFTT